VNKTNNPTNLKDAMMTTFNYELPSTSVAAWPAPNRHDAKLLIYNNGEIQTDIYLNIDKHLPENSLLVFNNTKVISARLPFTKSTGANIEIFLLEPSNGIEHATALAEKKSTTWKCLVGGIKKWKHDEVLEKRSNKIDNILYAALKERKDEIAIVEFSWNKEQKSFSEMISQFGFIPLPPYIKRETAPEDSINYQTTYAKKEGSVAAPTAGLHFTEAIFDKLSKKKIDHEFITLHVGAGTFKPVTSDNIAEHDMHEEFFEVDFSILESICNPQKSIVAVGTTSMRTLESLYWIGIKMKVDEISMQDNIHLGQWEHIDLDHRATLTLEESIHGILAWMKRWDRKKIVGTTAICITPGYRFRVCKAQVTNFHQPQSTLLLLIAAIMGDDWKRVYEYALKNNFRFLSYGDGSLLHIKQEED